MENLKLIIKKSRNVGRDAAAAYGDRNIESICYYWREPGHIAEIFENISKKDKRCENCGKKGRIIEDCWVCRKKVR